MKNRSICLFQVVAGLLGIAVFFAPPKLAAVDLVIETIYTEPQSAEITVEKFLEETVKAAKKTLALSVAAKTESKKEKLKKDWETTDEYSELSPTEVFEAVVRNSGFLLFYDGITVSIHTPLEVFPVLAPLRHDKLPILRDLLVPNRLSDEEFKSGIVAYPDSKVPQIVITGDPIFQKLVKEFASLVNPTDPTATPPPTVVKVRRLDYAYAVDFDFLGNGSTPFTIPGIISKLSNILGSDIVKVETDEEAKSGLAGMATSPPGQDASQPARLNALTRNQGAGRTDVYEAEILSAAARIADVRSSSDEVMKKVETQLKGFETKMQGAFQPDSALRVQAGAATGSLPLQKGIFADREQNAIVMVGTQAEIDHYEKIIDQLDVPIKAVEISVAIIDIASTSGFDWSSSFLAGGAGQHDGRNYSNVSGFAPGDATAGLGSQIANGNAPNEPINLPLVASPFKYDSMGNRIPKTQRRQDADAVAPTTTLPYLPFGKNAASAIGASLATADGFSASTLIVGSSYRILSKIEALESKGDARIISRPMIMTLDNVQALFDDKLLNYVPVSGLENSELFKIDTGIVLRVKPHIIDLDKGIQIRLAVHIEDGSDAGVMGDAATLEKSTITTQAIVPENQSLMIGGRYRKDEKRGESRVPFIGKVPVVGLAFKNKGVSNQQLQRFFLITPKVIDTEEMHSSVPERALDILTTTDTSDSKLAEQVDWNRENEALIFDAGNSGDLPGEKDGKPALGFLRRLIQKKASDH